MGIDVHASDRDGASARFWAGIRGVPIPIGHADLWKASTMVEDAVRRAAACAEVDTNVISAALFEPIGKLAQVEAERRVWMVRDARLARGSAYARRRTHPGLPGALAASDRAGRLQRRPDPPGCRRLISYCGIGG